MTRNNYFNKLRLMLAFALMIIVSSCAVVDKISYNKTRAVKQIAKAEYFYPDVLANFCKDNFIITVTKDSTIYLPGKPVYLPGPTQFVDCDSAIIANIKSGNPAANKKVACPPCADTIRFIDSLIQYRQSIITNQANEVVLLSKISNLEIEKAKAMQRAETYKDFAIWSSVIALILAIWKVLNWTGTIRF